MITLFSPTPLSSQLSHVAGVIQIWLARMLSGKCQVSIIAGLIKVGYYKKHYIIKFVFAYHFLYYVTYFL